MRTETEEQMENRLEDSFWGGNKPAQAFSSTGVPGKVRSSRQALRVSGNCRISPARRKWEAAAGGLRSPVMCMVKENHTAGSGFTPDTCKCVIAGGRGMSMSWPESSHHFHPWTPWVSLSLKTQWVGIFQILHSKTLLESLIKGPRRSPLTFPTWVA